MEPEPTLRHRLPRKSHNKMSDFQDSESPKYGSDYGRQLTQCTQTSTEDWTVWTPWMYLVRQLMRVRRRQLLFYSNGVQLQRVTRYLLDRISDANMTIGPGGPIDHEMSRWTASGMAQILDQSPEAAFTEARETIPEWRRPLLRRCGYPRHHPPTSGGPWSICHRWLFSRLRLPSAGSGIGD
jgi:hypothetical protein